MLIKFSWFVCFLYKIRGNWKKKVKILIKTYNIIKQIWKYQIKKIIVHLDWIKIKKKIQISTNKMLKYLFKTIIFL